MKNKSIIINEKAHKELKQLSESFGETYGGFVEKMVSYFKKTGNDPTDQKNYSASEKLQALDKRLVSFLKVQERDILKPLRQEVFDYYKSQESKIDKNQSDTLDILQQLNKNNRTRNQMVLKELEKQQKSLIMITEYLDKKDKESLITNIQNLFK